MSASSYNDAADDLGEVSSAMAAARLADGAPRTPLQVGSLTGLLTNLSAIVVCESTSCES